MMSPLISANLLVVACKRRRRFDATDFATYENARLIMARGGQAVHRETAESGGFHRRSDLVERDTPTALAAALFPDAVERVVLGRRNAYTPT
jgi:hypothetical protein